VDRISKPQLDAFCDLTVVADDACCEIICKASALHYYSGDFDDYRIGRLLREIRQQHEKLGFAIEKAEALFINAPKVARSPDELMQQLRASLIACQKQENDRA